MVALIREVGIAEGMTMLEVRGKEGDSGVGVVPLAPGTVVLSGSSHAVYHLISFDVLQSQVSKHARTMFVSI